MSELTDAITSQYPGAYDHLDESELEKLVTNKYPGAYDHLVNSDIKNEPQQVAQNNGSLFDRAVSWLKDPANVPVQMLKGFGEGALEGAKSIPDNAMRAISQPILPERPGLSDTSVFKKSIGNLPSLSEMYDAIQQNSSLMNIAPFLMHGASGATEQAPVTEEAPQNLPEVPLDVQREFAPVGEEGSLKTTDRPTFKDTNDLAFDLARNKFNMGRDLPDMPDARAGLIDRLASETGELGSGGAPSNTGNKSENYLQARQFFRDQGNELPKDVQRKATDISYDEGTGHFVANDPDKTRFDEEGNELELDKPSRSPSQIAANIASKAASNVLGVHIPGTAISYHAGNEIVRNAFFGGDQSLMKMPLRAGDAIYRMINPSSAAKSLDSEPPQEVANSVKYGLRLGTSPDAAAGTLFKGDNILTKGYNLFTNPKPIFDQLIPYLKYQTYKGTKNLLTGKGMSEEEAGPIAADYANSAHGGLTPNKLLADRNLQTMGRIALLAPDWLASNFRLGSGVVNALKNPNDPRGQMYLKGMRNFLAAYGAANAVNMYNNGGKTMLQNKPGKELSIKIGEDADGKERYLDWAGTAMDMIRLPVAIAHAALSSPSSGSGIKESAQIMRDHLNPIPHFITDLWFNQDSGNQPMYGKNYRHRSIDETDAMKNIASDAASKFLPIGMSEVLDWSQGKISSEELAEKLMQTPVSHSYTPKDYR